MPPLVTFWDTLAANEVHKNCQINLLGQEVSLGAVVPVPLLATGLFYGLFYILRYCIARCIILILV